MKLLLVCLVLVAQSLADQRIIDGKDVYPPGKWPWMGSLQFYDDPPGPDAYWVHRCGCAVISDTEVLTAAACVDGEDVDYLRVVLGAHDIVTEMEGDPEYYFVGSYIVHEDFVNDFFEGFPNDIAVVNLGSPINLGNEFIEILPMAESDNDTDGHVGQECMFAGWGTTTGDGSYTNVLKEAQMDVITNEECGEAWDDTVPITDSHICHHDLQGPAIVVPCAGDNGSPIFCRETEDDEWEMAGIGSWGSPQCLATFPSVASRISYFRDWIEWAMDQ